MEYRRLSYVIRPRGPGQWHWEVYQAASMVGCGKGHIQGSRHEAVMAAEGAIDGWLGKDTQTVDLVAAGNLSRENAEKIWVQIRRLERLAQRTPHELEKRAHAASIAHLKWLLPEL